MVRARHSPLVAIEIKAARGTSRDSTPDVVGTRTAGLEATSPWLWARRTLVASHREFVDRKDPKRSGSRIRSRRRGETETHRPEVLDRADRRGAGVAGRREDHHGAVLLALRQADPEETGLVRSVPGGDAHPVNRSLPTALWVML